MTFFINDQEVAQVEDDMLTSGTIGLTLDLYQEGELLVEFDDIVVTDLGEK